MESSPLQIARYAYEPKLPSSLRASIDHIACKRGEAALPSQDREALREAFPHVYGLPRVSFEAGDGGATALKKALTVGVILSGGPAPGGHNVIAGLYDGLRASNAASRLIGFRAGPAGLVEDKFLEITADILARYRNTGGFDIIGSGRTKIETPEQFEAALATAKRRGLDALVVIGGDDSNTNAAALAEYFAARGEGIAVIGVPKTIDGDLKSESIEASFGFDTATKLYSELIGNIARDAASSRKYWHFIKLMGRSASHIALECALQTRPNIALISEEIEAKAMSLGQIVEGIVAAVMARAAKGENFGVVLIPEGLIEFVPEMKVLIGELNEVLAAKEAEFKNLGSDETRRSFVLKSLSKASASLFESLPPDISKQLTWDRDPHGNVQVSRIETEKLLVAMVKERLGQRKARKEYVGKFDYQTHFLGYEGRCAFPSNFDADYCYSLGHTAFALIAHGMTGYIASIRNLAEPVRKWLAGGIPLVALMNMERRQGQNKAVIRKALVELEGRPFKSFAAVREEWALSSDYRIPGGIQYFGPSEVSDLPTATLRLERGEQ